MGSLEDGTIYDVVRSQRSTADIVIEPDGRVIVRVPNWLDDERIDKIVDAKSYWIYRNLAELRDLNDSRLLREFKNGEGFLYLGRSYRLRIVNDQPQPLLLKDGRFCLRRDILHNGDVAAAKRAFQAYYVERGSERIGARVVYYSPKVGVEPSSVTVRGTGNRWASCSPRRDLAFHWKCMMAPLSVVDYIVVHELCHIRHRDHTENFWNDVDKVMPTFRERKDWLRRHGAGLDL